MPATSMQVSLLTVTPDAMPLLYTCAKQCTSADDADDVYERAAPNDGHGYTIKDIISRDDQHKLIRRVIDSGHTSVVECVQLSFAVSGISRACSHQLVRHRVGTSFQQQSQRYVKADDFDYLIPPSIAAVPEIAEVYRRHMEKSNLAYGVISDMLALRGLGDKAAEDARFVLPNACATKLVVTMNCRALLHFFEERLCKRAQWEIRAMAKAMYDICLERLPVVFAGRGPKCKRLGYCSEHKSCGMMPKRGG